MVHPGSDSRGGGEGGEVKMGRWRQKGGRVEARRAHSPSCFLSSYPYTGKGHAVLAMAYTLISEFVIGC